MASLKPSDSLGAQRYLTLILLICG